MGKASFEPAQEKEKKKTYSLKKEAFKREQRLRKYSEFRTVKKEGRKFAGIFLLLSFRPNNRPLNRIGISVPKKIFPKASLRNRLRRLVREAYRRKASGLARGFDIVVSVLKKEQIPTYNEIAADLYKICRRAELIKK